MTPTVDTCNLALSLIGQAGTISSVSPPEGSVYAQLCASMYPLALGNLLEAHPWAFATRAAMLAPLAEVHPGFARTFALPMDCLRLWELRDGSGGALLVYERQLGNDGAPLVCTDAVQVLALYTRAPDVPQSLPPAFKTALAYLLASMIVGPIVKGEAGAAAAKSLAQMAQHYLAQAMENDATQKLETLTVRPPWLEARA